MSGLRQGNENEGERKTPTKTLKSSPGKIMRLTKHVSFKIGHHQLVFV